MLNWENITIFATDINLMRIKVIGVEYEIL